MASSNFGSVEHSLRDVVASQYEKWIYPEPITDLPGWLANNWEWFDPSHAHRMFWPDRDYRPNIDILIAGCGTNQAAAFAYTNPGARVVAIDVSSSSLAHHGSLKDRYGLENLELHHLPIEQAGTLGRDFDLIVSTGVLHHMASPEAGMQALAGLLKPHGVAAIMLYARYGRIGVEIMQAIFREINLKQEQLSLFTVREAIALLPANHPVRSYISSAPDLRFDAGIVDTFLHGRDRSYTVDDCLDLVASAGLAFQGWFFKSPYEPPTPPGGGFYQAVAALAERQRWGVMERINTENGCHFFMACRADRPLASYAIDLGTAQGLEAVPHFRYRCGIDDSEVYRTDWRRVLSDHELMLASLVDGRRSIRQIIAEMHAADSQSGSGSHELTDDALIFFQSLVNRDFIALGIQQ